LLTLRVMYYAKRSLLLQFVISSWLPIMLCLIAGHCKAAWWAGRLTKMPARALYHCSKASPLSSKFQYHLSWLRQHARCESVLRASVRLRTGVSSSHAQCSLSHDDVGEERDKMHFTCAHLMQTLLVLMTGRHPAKHTDMSDQHVQVSTEKVQQYEPGIGWQGCIVAAS
jgi:hypothetical protein